MSTTPTCSVNSVSDSLTCDECGFESVSSNGLKIHKSKKHEDISQIDAIPIGESSSVRDTYCWCEKHRNNSLKSSHTYQNALLDIKESPLSEEEMSQESELVTKARKQALGQNYIYCAPWNTT